MQTPTKTFVTPAMAKKYLENNSLNRQIFRGTVDSLIREMKAGQFKMTHQGILIGKDDVLIDGQHRLSAIAKSGIGQWMFVTKDEELSSPHDLPIDRQRPRSAAFILGLNQQLQSVASCAISVAYGYSMASLSDIKTAAEKLEPHFSRLVQGKKVHRRGISQAPVQLAGAVRIGIGEDPEYISNTYMALLNSDFKVLSPLPTSFYRQIVVDRVRFDARQLFSRAIRAFDASKQDTTKLQVKDEAFAFEEAKALVVKLLEQ